MRPLSVRLNLLAPIVCVGMGVFLGVLITSGGSDFAAAQENSLDVPPGFSAIDSAAAQPMPLPQGTSLPGGTPTLIQARPGRDVGASGEIIGFSHVDESGTQVISLVNTGKMWMAVYHVGPGGEIRLTSSRAIDADFSLELNVAAPTPGEIRRMQGSSNSR
ncbi:hypothetical protein LOC71_07440 [Rhodopirellula sp. JC740]|uniref:Secreted protein n=1 Tax=Rhodopirellula halodulae TaxID=2894198 RepID=A0ABS8NEX6_9BACT|nr:hypothetical protein [Rhodopirellula sp. JC740]MCC9642102.1 hypothetical protein [Rhodopirellula sp. JC740]